MNILKWMWKILPIMLLAVNATACNDDDDSGKRERPLTFEVTFLSLVCNYTRPVVVNAPLLVRLSLDGYSFTGSDVESGSGKWRFGDCYSLGRAKW